MKVLLMNTYSCCHQDQFMGVFESEEKAKESLIDMANKQYGKEADWQSNIKIWIEKDRKYGDYIICKSFLNNNTGKEEKTKLDYYYSIEDISLNELY